MKEIKNGQLNNQPLVSVVMPVYNTGRYLRDALESIIQQTYKNLEIICADDGSSDTSSAILTEYQKYDPRLKTHKNVKNRGIGYTANLLTALAQGKYIARMDADDISFLDRIEKQVEYLEKNPDTVAVGGQCVTIDKNDNISGVKVFPLNDEEIYRMIFTAIPLQQPAMMVSRQLLPKDYIWYDNNFSPVEDLDFYFRLFQFGKLANLADFVLRYREYTGSSTLKDPKRSAALTFTIRKRAIKNYGYTPSVRARLLLWLQQVAVALLPKKLVFPTFSFFRRFQTRNLLSKILTAQSRPLEGDRLKKESLEVEPAYEYQI